VATITTNKLFNNYRNKLGGNGNHALMDYDTDTWAIHLFDTGALALDDTFEDEADLTSGIIASLAVGTITVGTVGAGVVDAINSTFSSVSGVNCEALVHALDNGGVAATSPLLFAILVATGLPVTPTGADITIVHDGSGIIRF